MLLRASSEAIGEQAALEGALGQGDGGLPGGAELIRFAEAATLGSDDLCDARRELIAALGPEAFVEAAATVGIFNGLVRVADAIGVPLDDGTLDNSLDFRAALGIDEFGGARNTDLDDAQPRERAGSALSLLLRSK